MSEQDFHKKNEKLFDEHSLNFQVDHDAFLDSLSFAESLREPTFQSRSFLDGMNMLELGQAG